MILNCKKKKVIIFLSPVTLGRIRYLIISDFSDEKNKKE